MRMNAALRGSTSAVTGYLASDFVIRHSSFPPELPSIPLVRVLIVGCGYVGTPLGAELANLGHEVFGLRRSAAASDQLSAAGIKPLIADITRSETLVPLPTGFDWVVYCVASSGGGPAEYRQLYLEGEIGRASCRERV